MITLHVFGPMFGSPDPSPFGMKARALLELSRRDYKVQTGADPRVAPKGKVPWLDDDGTIVADTTFIRLHLEQRYGVDFYPGLSPSEKAVGWAFEKMCEEHLYFCVLYDRWMIDKNFDAGPRAFFDVVPAVMRPMIVRMVRRAVKRDLKGQGTGRHLKHEVEQLAGLDIEALANYLGDKPYFMGGAVTGVDAVVHGFLAAALVDTFDGPIRQSVLGHGNLVRYAERLNAHWYGAGQTVPASRM